MSTGLALLSRETQEGFELGNGPWYDEFFESLRSVLLDKNSALAFLYQHMLDEGGSYGWLVGDPNEQEEYKKLAVRLVDWLAGHADWQFAVDFEDDAGRDWTWENDRSDNVNGLNFEDFDVYKKTGSQHEGLE